jgi:hypothetical protein
MSYDGEKSAAVRMNRAGDHVNDDAGQIGAAVLRTLPSKRCCRLIE